MSLNEYGSCPDTAELVELTRGTLGPEREQVLTNHLNDCPKCQAFLDAEQAEFLQNVPESAHEPDEPSPLLWEKLRHLKQTTLVRPANQLNMESETRNLHAPKRNPSKAHMSGSQYMDIAPWIDPPSSGAAIGNLGPYELLEFVGRGGMGIVFRAKDPVVERQVAIKVLSPTLAADNVNRLRFMREARAAASINHPNVVTLHAVEETRGMQFLVMEFVPGNPLDVMIQGEQPLPMPFILNLGQQMASALHAAHLRGVVHRDVKPSNMILRHDGTLILTDFGLSVVVGDAKLTQSNTILGTPAFMAPEMVEQSTSDHRSDLFSLGSVLYLLCTNIYPFSAVNPHATLHQICTVTPQTVDVLNPKIPEWLSGLIADLQAKDPAQRPQTAAAVEAAFRTQQYSPHTQPIVLQPANENVVPVASKNSSRWTTVRWPLVGLLVIALGIVGWMVLPTNDDKTNNMPITNNQLVVRQSNGEQTVVDSLQEAIAIADADAVIELHGNGPFPLTRTELIEKPLTISAHKGSRPLIVLQSSNDLEEEDLLRTDDDLTLIGLEVRGEGAGLTKPNLKSNVHLIHCTSRCTIRDCRLVAPGSGNCLVVEDCSQVTLQGCELHAGTGNPLVIYSDNVCQIHLSQCLMTGDTVVSLNSAEVSTINLTQNTFFAVHFVEVISEPDFRDELGLEIMARANIFDTSGALLSLDHEGDLEAGNFGWQGLANVYTTDLMLEWDEMGAQKAINYIEWLKANVTDDQQSVQTSLQYVQPRDELVQWLESPNNFHVSQFRVKNSEKPLPLFNNAKVGVPTN